MHRVTQRPVQLENHEIEICRMHVHSPDVNIILSTTLRQMVRPCALLVTTSASTGCCMCSLLLQRAQTHRGVVVGGEAVLCVVGQLHGLVLGVELWQQKTKEAHRVQSISTCDVGGSCCRMCCASSAGLQADTAVLFICTGYLEQRHCRAKCLLREDLQSSHR